LGILGILGIENQKPKFFSLFSSRQQLPKKFKKKKRKKKKKKEVNNFFFKRPCADSRLCLQGRREGRGGEGKE
jgi:hypothetical protein